MEPAPSFVVEPLADGVHERREVVPGLLLELADASGVGVTACCRADRAMSSGMTLSSAQASSAASSTSSHRSSLCSSDQTLAMAGRE